MTARVDEPATPPKPVRWLGSSREDLSSFPKQVRQRVGGALWKAQIGRKAAYAKPLKGFAGAGVLEVVVDFDGGAFRAVYTVRFARGCLCAACLPEEIQAWHRYAKGRVGPDRQTPQAGKRGLQTMVRKRRERIKVTPSSGNVFADLGLPQPEEELAKSQLAAHIEQTIARRRLTQAQAAVLMGIDQPKVSALINGRLENFSSERLMKLLTRLGQDVDITVRAKPHRRRQGRIRVIGEMRT